MSSHKSNHQARTGSSFVTSAANRWHWLTASLAICLLALSFPMGLHAQEYRGLILGQVKDPSGAVIGDAKITAKGAQQTYTAKTNGSGDFSIPFVQPGTYQVSVEAHGFKKSVEKNVVISVAQKVNLNFRMEVGATTENVEVVASAVAVNTADASGGSVIGQQETQNLPLPIFPTSNTDLACSITASTDTMRKGTSYAFPYCVHPNGPTRMLMKANTSSLTRSTRMPGVGARRRRYNGDMSLTTSPSCCRRKCIKDCSQQNIHLCRCSPIT